jgi:3-hydroxyacyl-[acyl-carrier-protein] dehydratase
MTDTRKKCHPLFGVDVILDLIPHRPPLLLVDYVTDYHREPMPVISAARHISLSEPVFAGHFPGLHLWPGVYTAEGMGQSCHLLCVLLEIVNRFEQQGGDVADALSVLAALDASHRMQPGLPGGETDSFLQTCREVRMFGIASGMNIKFHRPVFAGCLMEYRAMLTHRVEEQLRFDVSAQVDRITVASGTITAKVGLHYPISASSP